MVWSLNPHGLTAHFPTPALAPTRTPTFPRGRTVAGLAEWQKNKIMRYIDDNVESCIRVQELGAQVRLSASRFSKGFKVSFGKSPYDYVLARRIEAAKYLITCTDEPLSQIAQACGLSDQAHLSKVFKRLVGVTPLNWRRRHASGSAVPVASQSWSRLAQSSERVMAM
ncbi:helix-turn-helix transcriptional regulator [Agrobacterium sp. S2]|nr:helix-turn-helix transcriptional regulator [Agrobacterium sp. S2]